MEALKASSLPSVRFNLMCKRAFGAKFEKLTLNLPLSPQPIADISSIQCRKANLKLPTAISSTVSTGSQNFIDQVAETLEKEEKFDWYAHWYPVMPICDLDKRRPQGKKVIGLDIVIWWDRNENEWKVFDDTCPHRLAPLSDGRIDQSGRLQCVYHGWCFGGSGDCKLIPQAPRDGPPVHTANKACAVVYPSCVQNNILWFWPNADHQYKDILSREKPPYFEEMDDPSFSCLMMTRDFPFGYEVLIENLMDPSHIPYAHYGMIAVPEPAKSVRADREGGRPIEMSVKTFNINGFNANTEAGRNIFIPPCIFYSFITLGGNASHQSASSDGSTEKRNLLVFFCVPVSPGKSRLIYTQPRNVAAWMDRVIPRWVIHIRQNLFLDSDLYLLHVQERKIRDIGSSNWSKACFVPTKADALVVAFRRWLNKYGGGQVDWGSKFSGYLPPTPPREQLMDRYWTHTVSCSSCNRAYKCLNALEIGLQIIAIASIGIVAAAKQNTLSLATRNALVPMAVLCFVASKWLSCFIYKTYHFHDYDHAFR